MPKRRGRGEGSLEELPSGSWRVVLSYTDPLTKKREKESKTFESKKHAIDWRNERIAARRTSASVTNGQMLLRDWSAQWLDKIKDTREPATHFNYTDLIGLATAKLGHFKLNDITAVLVERWLLELAKDGKSGNRRAKALKILCNCLNRAVALGLILANPADRVEAPKSAPSRSVWLDIEQAQKLLAHFETFREGHFSALMCFALDSGARPNEILGLHWPEVDLASSKVTIKQTHAFFAGKNTGVFKPPKTRAGIRTISISARTVELLKELRVKHQQKGWDVENAVVFLGRLGKIQLCKNLNHILKKQCPQIGVPSIRFGDLRHTSISILLSRGLSIRAVATRAGHESPEVTLRKYARALPTDDAKAIEIWGGLLS